MEKGLWGWTLRRPGRGVGVRSLLQTRILALTGKTRVTRSSRIHSIQRTRRECVRKQVGRTE